MSRTLKSQLSMLYKTSPNGIMLGQNWNDSSSAGESNSWFQPNYRVMISRTEDGAMSLTSKRNCHHISSNRNS